MYSLSDLCQLKGYRIHIITPEGEYEGFLKHVSKDQLTMERVLIMPKKDPVGTLNFFVHELKSCKIVQEPKSVSKKENNSQKESKCIVSNLVDYRTLTIDVHALKQNDKLGFISERRANEIQDFSDYFADSDGSSVEEAIAEEEEEEEFVLSLPKYLGSRLPLDWLVVNEINDEFFNAVKHINQESVVAVSFEGQSIGRSGKLSWIVISTRFCTFLFDILVLQNEAFQKGLKEVFENPRVQKVIHDCRQPSDALFHQYQTNLVNIFDTQVADVFVNLHKSRNEKVNPNVTTLSRSIHRYLNLRQEDIYPNEVDYRALKEAVDWRRRPVNNVMKEVAIKNVILLRELRSVLLELMLLSYTQAVDVYLRVLRNATPEELELNPSSPDLLPEALLMNGLHAIQCKEFTEAPIFPSNTSAIYKNEDRDIFDFVLNSHAKEITSKRNLRIPSRPQKKRRSASNRPLRQNDASLSSEDEEMVNNERRKPKKLSNRPHQSINSNDKAGVVDKEIMCNVQPMSPPDTTVFEKISRISQLTLRDRHPDNSKPSIGDSRRCADPIKQCFPTSRLSYHLVKGSFTPSPIKQEVISEEPPKINPVVNAPNSKLICDDVSTTPRSEIKLKHQPNPQKASKTAHSGSIPNGDVLKNSTAIAAVKLNAKKIKIKYVPAGMLS